MSSARSKRSALSKRVIEITRYVRHTNEFGKIRRTIWRSGSPDGDEGKERNDSHVYQLMDVAWYIQQRFLPHMNLLKLWQYCMVHDKPEVYAGDTPAFPDKNGVHNGPGRDTKAKRERVAVMRLKKEWGREFPDFLDSLSAYENQEDEESRFVYALDKFLSDLNIFEDNGRTNQILGITREEQIAYKRPRIASHPFVLELYDEWLCGCESLPDLFFQVDDLPKAAE